MGLEKIKETFINFKSEMKNFDGMSEDFNNI